MDDPDVYSNMSFAHNPYGDGNASSRIVEPILSFCGVTEATSVA